MQSSILEVAVSGSILGCMVKCAANIRPQRTLEFLVPHLSGRLHSALEERVDAQRKADVEVQFCSLLLGELVGFWSPPTLFLH